MRQIIGVGNPYRGDDAAGLEVARALRGRVGPGVEVLECEAEPSRLLDLWADAEAVVVIDAVRSGAPAGTLHHYDARAAALPAPVFRSTSSHAVGVAEAVELGRSLDRLPVRLEIYGIEGASFALGEGLSPEVEAAVGALADQLARGLTPYP